MCVCWLLNLTCPRNLICAACLQPLGTRSAELEYRCVNELWGRLVVSRRTLRILGSLASSALCLAPCALRPFPAPSIHHQSSSVIIVHRPSSIIHHPSFIINHDSSSSIVIHHPSSVIHQPQHYADTAVRVCALAYMQAWLCTR